MGLEYRSKLAVGKILGAARRALSALTGPTATQVMLSDLRSDDLGLTGKRVLITGSTRGIGRETASEFARMGAIVVIHGRSDAQARMVADALAGDHGVRTASVGGDLAVEGSGREVVERAVNAVGGLDVVINNAAVHDPRRKALWATSSEELERMLRVNVIAPFEIAGAAVHHMLDRRTGGRIINVSSHAADPARASDSGIASYGISKVALEAVSTYLAAELRGISVATLRIDAVDTDMTKMLFPLDQRWLMSPASAAARALAHLATAPSLEIHGKIFGQRALLAALAIDRGGDRTGDSPEAMIESFHHAAIRPKQPSPPAIAGG